MANELDTDVLSLQRKNKQLINTVELMDIETHKQRNDLQVAYNMLANAYAFFKQLQGNPSPNAQDLILIDIWLTDFAEFYPQMTPKEDPLPAHHGNK